MASRLTIKEAILERFKLVQTAGSLYDLVDGKMSSPVVNKGTRPPYITFSLRDLPVQYVHQKLSSNQMPMERIVIDFLITDVADLDDTNCEEILQAVKDTYDDCTLVFPDSDWNVLDFKRQAGNGPILFEDYIMASQQYLLTATHRI